VVKLLQLGFTLTNID